MNQQTFLANLTELQKDNWRKLVEGIRAYGSADSDNCYHHIQWQPDKHDDMLGRCAYSIAVWYGITNEKAEKYSTWEDVDRFAMATAFGQDAFTYVFDGESSFAKMLDNHDDHEATSDDDWDCFTIADLLSEFVFGSKINAIQQEGEIKAFTIHWKSSQKDNFASLEHLTSFLELNPQRAKGYRKITVTKLMPRTVYDEVVEVVTL